MPVNVNGEYNSLEYGSRGNKTPTFIEAWTAVASTVFSKPLLFLRCFHFDVEVAQLAGRNGGR